MPFPLIIFPLNPYFIYFLKPLAIYRKYEQIHNLCFLSEKNSPFTLLFDSFVDYLKIYCLSFNC